MMYTCTKCTLHYISIDCLHNSSLLWEQSRIVPTLENIVLFVLDRPVEWHSVFNSCRNTIPESLRFYLVME